MFLMGYVKYAQQNMAVNDRITLNRVLDVIREIADNHEMIADFSIGDAATRGHNKGEDQDDEPEELDYPYLWADPASAGYEIGQNRSISAKLYNISLFVADKHSDNAQNDTEILSDTEGILSDIVQFIATHPTLIQFGLPIGTIQANPSRHDTIHDVYGWEVIIPIKVPYKFCHTDLPIS